MHSRAITIMANCRNGTLYTGVTADIARRVHEHAHARLGFTMRYSCTMFV